MTPEPQVRVKTFFGTQYVCDDQGVAVVRRGAERKRLPWSDLLTVAVVRGEAGRILVLATDRDALRIRITWLRESFRDRQKIGQFVEFARAKLKEREDLLRGKGEMEFRYPPPLLASWLRDVWLPVDAFLVATILVVGGAMAVGLLPVFLQVLKMVLKQPHDPVARVCLLTFAAASLYFLLLFGALFYYFYAEWRKRKRNSPVVLKDDGTLKVGTGKDERTMDLREVVFIVNTPRCVFLTTAKGVSLLADPTMSFWNLLRDEITRRRQACGAQCREGRTAGNWNIIFFFAVIAIASAAVFVVAREILQTLVR